MALELKATTRSVGPNVTGSSYSLDMALFGSEAGVMMMPVLVTAMAVVMVVW